MPLTTEKKVGLFFLLALIAFGVMIEMVDDWSLFSRSDSYHAYFDAIVGLNPGDPVRMSGVDVGRVTAISIENGQVRVDFEVETGTVLRSDSVAEVRRTNLLGGLFLGLSFGQPQSPAIPPGSPVATLESANLDQMLTNFDRNQEQILGRLGTILEKSQEPIVRAFARLDSILQKIDAGQGSLGRLVNDPQLYDDLASSVRQIDTLTARINRGEGTLGKALTDEQMYRDLAASAASLRAMTHAVEEGQGAFGTLLSDEQVAADLKEALAHLRSISKKIDQGQGTLGKMVNDDTLYKQAGQALKKVDRAAEGMGDAGPVSALGAVAGALF